MIPDNPVGGAAARLARRAGRAGRATVGFLAVPIAALAGAATSSTSLDAQSLADRVRAASGAVEFRFAAREGVCGDGGERVSVRTTVADRTVVIDGDDAEWSRVCRRGPVRVVLHVEHGTVVRLHTYVGEPDDGAHAAHPTRDLGTVSTHEATDFLLALARTAPEEVSAEAVSPAAFADSVTIWPALVELARTADRPVDTRKRALFWAGQLGGREVLAPVSAIVADDTQPDALRTHALFVLSQLPDGAGVPALMAVADDSAGSYTVRKRALFWLAATHDPRVPRFLSRILDQ